MAKSSLIKLHKQFTFLSKGEFSREDFSKEFGDGDDAGWDHVGKLPGDRIKLIISDAKRNLAKLEKKHPFLKELNEKPVEVKEEEEKPKTTKKKEKEE